MPVVVKLASFSRDKEIPFLLVVAGGALGIVTLALAAVYSDQAERHQLALHGFILSKVGMTQLNAWSPAEMYAVGKRTNCER